MTTLVEPRKFWERIIQEPSGCWVAATAITSHGRWIVYDVNDDCAPGVFYATAADAVRAAREADRG